MFLRKLFSATLLPALVLSSMAIVFAQLGTAGISGQVLDTNGAAVPSARVVVIAEVFNLFNVTNIRGVNNVNFSGFQNTLLRDSANSATPAICVRPPLARQCRLQVACLAPAGLEGSNLPYGSITEGWDRYSLLEFGR